MNSHFSGILSAILAFLMFLFSLLFHGGSGEPPKSDETETKTVEEQTEQSEVRLQGAFDGFSWVLTDDGILTVSYHADVPNAVFSEYKDCDGYVWRIDESSLFQKQVNHSEVFSISGVAFTDREHGAVLTLIDHACGNRIYKLYTTQDGGNTWTFISKDGSNYSFSTSLEEVTAFYLFENGQCLYATPTGETGLLDVSWKWVQKVSGAWLDEYPDHVTGQNWEFSRIQIGDVTETEVTLHFIYRGVPTEPGGTVIADIGVIDVTLKRENPSLKPIDPPWWDDGWDDGK